MLLPFVLEVMDHAFRAVIAAFFSWALELTARHSLSQAHEAHVEGRTLIEMRGTAIWIQRLRLIDAAEPHRPIYRGPANQTERSSRDLARECHHEQWVGTSFARSKIFLYEV